MANQIQDAIEYIQATIVKANFTNVRNAPDEVPEKMDVFPFSVVFPRSANWDAGVAGEMLGSPLTIALQIHFARKDLPRDYAKTEAYVQEVPKELWNDPRLGGNVDTIQAVRMTQFGRLDWGPDTKTFGIEWEIDLKIRIDLSA